MISPPQNLHKTFIKSYMLKQILHYQTRSDTMRATLARCFVSNHSFLFVLWRISQSLVTYLTRSLQGEKIENLDLTKRVIEEVAITLADYNVGKNRVTEINN